MARWHEMVFSSFKLSYENAPKLSPKVLGQYLAGPKKIPKVPANISPQDLPAKKNREIHR